MTRLLLLTLLLGVSGNISVYFSPNGGCEEAVISAIENADSTVDVALYIFTEGDIARALTRAHYRKVQIRVLIDNQNINQKYSKAQFLHNEGILIRSDSRSALMHHKFAVIDDSIVLTGSYNWTASAESINNENLLVITSKYLASLYKAEFLKLWFAGTDFSPPTDTESTQTIVPTPEPIPDTEPSSAPGDYTVYITKTGAKYHRGNCRYLKYSKYAILKSEAIRRGYTPCSVCNP